MSRRSAEQYETLAKWKADFARRRAAWAPADRDAVIDPVEAVAAGRRDLDGEDDPVAIPPGR
jgi:hypothetical protein